MSLCTSMVIPRSILLRTRNFSHKKNAQKIKTHILCSTVFFSKSVVYNIMWENMVQPDWSQMAIYEACAFHAGLPRQEYILIVL